jgi:uncharacterized membrane protein YedE/YeeE
MSVALFSIYWISFALTALVLVHALTRSERDWLAADRSKSYWVTWLIIGMIFGPVGVIAAIVYLIAVVSQMGSSTRAPGPFDKQ